MPANISAANQKALEDSWNESARLRNEAIERETRIPTEPSLKLKYEIRRFGKYWNSYYQVKNKMVPLLPAPSLFTSAIGALNDKIEEAIRK